MATLHWSCSACRRLNQRRGVYPHETHRDLRCPGCHRLHRIEIDWRIVYEDRVCPGCRDHIEKINVALTFRGYRDKIASLLQQIGERANLLSIEREPEKLGAGLGFIAATVMNVQMLYDLMPKPAEQKGEVTP